MSKVKVVLVVALVGILLYIGGSIYYDMATEIENNPDIKEMGGPPVITDLRILVALILALIWAIGVICILFGWWVFPLS